MINSFNSIFVTIYKMTLILTTLLCDSVCTAKNLDPLLRISIYIESSVSLFADLQEMRIEEICYKHGQVSLSCVIYCIFFF